MTEREKLLKLMETEGLNAKQFAAEVGIQAGTISNIVNGRNKPSLEVLQKVLNRFRTISSDWLILDSGTMYRPTGEQPARTLFDEPLPVEPAGLTNTNSPASSVQAEIPIAPNSGTVSKENHSTSQPTSILPEAQPIINTPQRTIEKIVVFYSDGTYENFAH